MSASLDCVDVLSNIIVDDVGFSPCLFLFLFVATCLFVCCWVWKERGNKDGTEHGQDGDVEDVRRYR